MKTLLKKIKMISGIVLAAAVLSIIAYFAMIWIGAIVVDEKKLVLHSATSLIDQEGRPITKLYLENREIIDIDKVPKHVQNAFIAVEDKRFYEHHGIDFRAISRALFKDIAAFKKVEGGSTITQQLAKNVFLTNDKTVLRKMTEAIIAIYLEQKYSKRKILEMYLNQIYFGHGVYGIQSASKFFFNKDASELTIEEGALLAGLPKAPAAYSPILHPEKSLERRNAILTLMERENYISPEQAVRSQGKTLGLNIHKTEDKPWLSAYIDMVFEEAENKYHLSNEELLKGGYKITVPINIDVQEKAFKVFKEKAYFQGTKDDAQGAFILLDNKTGGVLAAIGGRNYVSKGFNRLTAKRQPGSTFKPIAVYAPAMEEGLFQPYSLLKDEKLDYKGYSPSNYDGRYDGHVTMFDALIHSKNAPSVWVLDKLGIDKSKEYLEKNGIYIEDKGLAIALGGLKYGVSPFDLANAYRTFANNGQYSKPYFIQKIVNANGDVVAEVKKQKYQVFSPQTSWNMTRMLEQVVKEGTAKAGQYEGALAGKTGTTSFPGKKGAVMDAWFVGYTPDVTGAVWIGYDRTDEEHFLKGGSDYPTKMFKNILSGLKFEEKTSFTIPKKVKDLEKPIRLSRIFSLSATYQFHALQLFKVTLKWPAQDDDRVVYRIYERSGESKKLVGSVKGKGEYEIPYINIFSEHFYQVVPYNPQTHQEGEGTDFVSPRWE